tara:strand:+ start:2357 stop:2899 length:543 start_codon:yes stop_codon:yes gene_type:complete
MIYIILTKAKWEGKLPSKLKKSDKLSWNEFTYKDVSKTAKRNVDATLPTDDNLKSEITAFMDTHSIDYSSGDTKAELLAKIDEHILLSGVPQVEEEYTYTDQEIDTTTLQDPTWKESAFKLGKLGSPRWNNDNSKVIVKYELPIQDGTFAELDGISGITLFSKSEALEEMKKEEWSSPIE